jgi:metal-responsive CopG/Arc/MetJ family transcriptional regulator
MRNTLKIAISLPKEDYYKLEQIRKKLGFGRSSIIDKAIRFWLNHRERADMIKRYEEGYRKKPESIQEIEAFEKAAADAFREEGLQ